jgi:hypothetical protein
MDLSPAVAKPGNPSAKKPHDQKPEASGEKEKLLGLDSVRAALS